MDHEQLSNSYYVMRHGQSLGNVQNKIVSSPEKGVNGFGLTREGKAQALASIKKSSGLNHKTIVYASDFLRTRETAQIVCRVLQPDLPVTYTPYLRERFFGNWELTSCDNYPLVWEEDAKTPEPPSKNVESVNSVLARAISCLREIEAAHKKKTILLVSHGDTLQILLCFFHGLHPSHHRELKHLKTAEIRRAI